MPRIDQFNIENGKFKKTKVRSWDDDLVNSLRISKDQAQTSKEEEESSDSSIIKSRTGADARLGFNKGSKSKAETGAGLEFDKGSKSKTGSDNGSGFNKGSRSKAETGAELEFDKGSKSKTGSDNGLGFNKGSRSKAETGAGLEFDKGSKSKTGSEAGLGVIKPETPSFLDEDFRHRKVIKRLSGHEQKILIAILKICLKKGSIKTGNISSEDFDKYLSIARNSRETALKRLCKKGIVKRFSGKRGAKGTLNLGFSSDLARDIAKELYESGELNILAQIV